jgi:hypothetical protein
MISLTLQSTINMTIDNQCSNIELTSLIHFTKSAMCCIQFPQKVSSKSIMKANFITGIDQTTFGGALLYHLQGKKDMSTNAQLLVIWGYNADEIYLHTWLIRHNITLDWDEDKLKRFYDVYNSQYKVYTAIFRKEWLLDDKTMLKTKCGSSHGGFEMELIISRDEYLSRPIKPLWIDPNR